MPLRFTFRQLEYLVAVGETGSITAAADKVRVSSPSISAAIGQLEAELGVQLFVRQHGHGLTLTAGGRRVVNRARQVLHDAASLNDVAGEVRDRARGPIAIGTLITVAPLIAASVRRSFLGAHPEAEVTQREAHQGRLLEMLDRAEIDVAVTYDLQIPKDVAFEGMVALPPWAMLAADHPLAGRDRVALEALVEEPMVLLDLPFSREYFLSMFETRGLRPNIAERSTELAVTRSLIANGFGYGLINIRTGTDLAPDGGRLAFVRLEGEHRPMILGTACKCRAHKPRIVRAFEDHLRARAKGGSLPGMAAP